MLLPVGLQSLPQTSYSYIDKFIHPYINHPFNIPIYPPTHPSVLSFDLLPSIHLSIHPPINLFFHLPDRPFHPSIHWSVHPSVQPFIHLTVPLSIYPSIDSLTHPFIRPFIHSFIHPSVNMVLFRARYYKYLWYIWKWNKCSFSHHSDRRPTLSDKQLVSQSRIVYK